MDIMSYVLIDIIVLVAIFVKMALVIIPQSETKIIERLGRYHATLKPGINIIIPFIDRAKSIVTMQHGRYVYTNTIDLREQVFDFARQNVITKDNIQMEINALLYFQIMDSFKAVYEINNLPNAIEKLTQTTLRNIIGEMDLDTTLTSRDKINEKMRDVLDDATNKQYVGVSNLQEVEKGEIVVFNKTANKEVLLTYFDRFYEPYTSAQLNYGPIGIVFEEELDENNKLVTAPVPEGKTVDELRLKNAPMGALCLTQNEWDNYVNMEPRAVLRLERLQAYEKPYTVEGVRGFPNISYTAQEINELAKYEQNLSDVIASKYTAWMIGGNPITDDEWNAFQTGLVNAGLEKIKQINQDGFNRYLEAIGG